MLRQKLITAAAVGVTGLLSVVFVPLAQSVPLDPSTSVSDDGRIGVAAPAVASSKDTQTSFSGTGKLADSSGVNTELTAPEDKGITPGAASGFGPNTIIGPDGRSQVTDTTTYPARATVYLTYTKPDGRTSWCTGWLYAPNAVATAGHCVHSGGTGGAWNFGFTVYLGRNAASAPFGSCTVATKFSVLGWTRDRNTLYDYGALKLNCTIGNTVGWYGMRWQTASYDGTTIFSRGYPEDKPSATQWFTADQVRQSDAQQLRYHLDTVGGQSGSPVYMFGCGEYCGIAVHTTGFTDHNRGTRITEEVFNNYQAWTL